jgi:hypothetical protein
VCTLLGKKGFPIFDFPSIDQKPKITQTFNTIRVVLLPWLLLLLRFCVIIIYCALN